jgi:hypothetical protein
MSYKSAVLESRLSTMLAHRLQNLESDRSGELTKGEAQRGRCQEESSDLRRGDFRDVIYDRSLAQRDYVSSEEFSD